MFHLNALSKHVFQFLIDAVFTLLMLSILCWGKNIQNNYMTLATS
jgi:hypothetical protein